MIQELGAKPYVVGTKSVLKAIAADQLSKVYLATDVDEFIVNKIQSACTKYQIPLEASGSMEEMGQTCGIDVGAACVGVLK